MALKHRFSLERDMLDVFLHLFQQQQLVAAQAPGLVRGDRSSKTARPTSGEPPDVVRTSDVWRNQAQIAGRKPAKRGAALRIR